jgi:cytochrome c-type biogenesis protein CcmE
MKKGYLVATLLALGFIALGVTAFTSTLTPYLSFEDARESSGIVQVMGGLDRQSVRYDAAGGELSFALLDEKGASMPVAYRGTRPANFQDAISIVAIGPYRDGRIQAEKLLVKCPSKYQGAEVKEYPAAPAPAPPGSRT